MGMPTNIFHGIGDTCNIIYDITRYLPISESIYKYDSWFTDITTYLATSRMVPVLWKLLIALISIFWYFQFLIRIIRFLISVFESYLSKIPIPDINNWI